MEENKKTDLTKESNFDLIWTSHFSPVDSFTITKWPGRVEDTSLICNVAVRDTNVSSEATIEGLIPYTYQGIDDQDYFQIYDQEEEEIEDEADKLDKCIAIASGLISGIIDVLFVGEFSLQRAKQYGEKDVENIVKKTAKKFGYKGEDLKGAIAHLEKKFPFAADSRVADFGGAKQHHLRDFSHHFSLFGLLCSILTQFTGKVIGTNTAGMLLIRDVSEEMMIGKNLPEKILFGTVFWFFHMVSDMAGSSFSFGRGTGIPGPIVSVIKLFSAIPLFRETKIGEHEFHVWVSKLFNGTLIKRRNNAGQIVDSVPFDLRTEIGILHEGSKQLIPVLINEAIVRGFYLIRRTHREIVEKDIKSIRDLNKIDTQKILPINNPAIRRMCTLSSGVFCAVDIIDALIRAIIEQNPGTFFLRLNYVGIARFIVAIGAEASAFLKETQEDRKRSSYRRYREEQEIAGLKWFALDADQTQILLSLQKQLCLYDISHTQEKSKREKKEQWLNTWIHGMEQSIGVISEAEDQFILDEAQIYEKLEQIKETATKESLYLIALEAMTFIPYFPLEEKDVAKYKGIKQDVSYLDKVFYNKQSVIKKKTAEEIRSCYRWYYDLFSGRIRNRWIIGIGTVAITAITAGLAFHFAPAIAVALAGKAGLSGAALTSYSLAAIGGGSLAAGGLGMAGGTMIIAGGGAMLGVLGGAGLSSMTSMMLLESDGYVLNECSKLLGFTEKILLKEEYAFSSISELECVLNSRIETLGELLKETKEEVSQIKEQNQKKKKEERIKTAEKSLWYLSETAKHLKELRNRIPQKQEKAVPQEHTTSMIISPTTETK